MYIIEALVGVGLLAFGRKLFWLFVAGVGFAAGLALTAALFKTSPAWEVLLIAFGAGLAGALLAVFLQRIAMGVGGFIGGAQPPLTPPQREGEFGPLRAFRRRGES